MDLRVDIRGLIFKGRKVKKEFHKVMHMDWWLPDHQIICKVYDLYEGGGWQVRRVVYARRNKRCRFDREQLKKLYQYGRSLTRTDDQPPVYTVVCEPDEDVRRSFHVPGAYVDDEGQEYLVESQRPRQHNVAQAQTQPAEQRTNQQMQQIPQHRRQVHAGNTNASDPALTPDHRPHRQRNTGQSAAPTYDEAPRHRPSHNAGQRRSIGAVGQQDDADDPLEALLRQEGRQSQETNGRRDNMPGMWDQEAAGGQRSPERRPEIPSSLSVRPSRSQDRRRMQPRCSTVSYASSPDRTITARQSFSDLRSSTVISRVQAHAASSFGSQSTAGSDRPPGFFDFFWRRLI